MCEKNGQAKEFQMNDLPKTKLKDDELNRADYVQSLAAFLRICEMPMTVAVQGDWGIGKTSFINMVCEELPKDAGIEWKKFNPWKISAFHREEQVTLAFLGEMLSTISEQTQEKAEERKDAEKKIRKIREILSGLAVDLTRKYLGDTAGNVMGKIICDGENDDAKNELSFAEQMEILGDYFRELIEGMTCSRLIFFIEDLDYINPKIAVELLELFKILFDHPKCIFVVAVDETVVRAGVKEKYGNTITDEKAKAFFGKIFQLIVQLPGVSVGDHKFWEKLLPLDVNANMEMTDWLKTAVYFMTRGIPRELKRFSNTFRMRCGIEKKKAYFMPEESGETSETIIRWNMRYLILDTLMFMYYPGIYQLYKARMSFAFLYAFIKYGKKMEKKNWTRQRTEEILGRLEILDCTDMDGRLPQFCQTLYDFFDQYRNVSFEGNEGVFQFANMERAVCLVRGEVYPNRASCGNAKGLFAWMDSILSEPFYRRIAGESPLDCGRYYNYYSRRSHMEEGKFFFRLRLFQDVFDPDSKPKVIVEFHKEWMDEMTEGKTEAIMEQIRGSLAVVSHGRDFKSVEPDECMWQEFGGCYAFDILGVNQAAWMINMLFELSGDRVIDTER